MYKKVTIGFVVQTFDDNGEPTEQEFIAGDEVTYENGEGEIINTPENEIYLPFDMVQPMHIHTPPKS